MFKILSTYICLKKIYKMQHLEGSSTAVLYRGRTVLKGQYYDWAEIHNSYIGQYRQTS